MLTVKAPLEITAKTSYIRDPESFYHRIVGNYSLMETRVNEEDLLHITTTPPEIYVMEGEGVSSIFNQATRNESNYNKVEILNNVLNRIVVSADMNLTYQDRVFITDALYKMGIRDDRKFMKSFFKMAEETKNTNSLINLYIEQGQDLKELVEFVEENSEKEIRTETVSTTNEEKNFLYNNIFNRLSTGAIYQIVSNFNRSTDFNEIDKNEYSLSEQNFTAQNIFLSMMRERAHVGQQNLFLLNDNTYEESIESAETEVTNVKNEINSAVLNRLLQNIYRTGFEKFFLSKNTYFKFEDTFYKASDQIISRLISNFGAPVTKSNVTRVLNEVKNEQLYNELQLFNYSRQNEFDDYEIKNMEDILQNIEINNKTLTRNLEEYNQRTFFSASESLSNERKALPRSTALILKTTLERAEGEDFYRITERIRNAEGAIEIQKILSEYLEENFANQLNTVLEENYNISKESRNLVQRLVTEKESEYTFENLERVKDATIEVLENILGQGKKESFSEIENSVRNAEGPLEVQSILNEYLEEAYNNRISAYYGENISFSEENLSLLQLLAAEKESEYTLENLENIKELIRSTSELRTQQKISVLETITAVELKVLKEYEAAGKEEQLQKEELINLISESTSFRVSEEKTERIRDILRELQSEKLKVSVNYTDGDTYNLRTETETDMSFVKEELTNLISESTSTNISEEKTERIRETLRDIEGEKPAVFENYTEGETYNLSTETENHTHLGKEESGQDIPAELVYETSVSEEDENTIQSLVINRSELMKLFFRELEKEQSPERISEKTRNIIRQIAQNGEKVRAGYEEGGSGYEAFKKVSQEEPPETPDQQKTQEEAELVHEKEEGKITDEDIRRLTEHVNRIESLNEERRRKYIEVIRSINSREENKPPENVFEKTMRMAELSLSSPEKFIESIRTETIIRENKEKEILEKLKDIFPEQSLEIFQLLNNYHNNPTEFINESILRNAEVGELIYDINNAIRQPAEMVGEKSSYETEGESIEVLLRERPSRAAVNATESHQIRPVETIHKVTETLTEEELNEQLELMRHNLKKQIREEVKSDVVNETHSINAKEVTTTDNVTSQMSQVNIQKMIDSTVRSEMNTISTQVMNKLERQLRNEKIRRGY